MTRLATLTVLVVLTATPALAQTPSPERLVDAGKVFIMLDKFYAVPPAERSELAVGYIVLHDKKPDPNVHLALVVGGKRTPIPVTADGRLERLPTPAELAAHAQVAVEASAGPMGIRLDLGTTIKPAQEINPAECALAISQVNAAISRAAGLLALVVPKIKATSFPGAGSGVAVMADGKTVPLPLIRGMPAYDPSAIKGAKTIRLAKSPTSVSLE